MLVLQAHVWSKPWLPVKRLYDARPHSLFCSCHPTFQSPHPCLCNIGAVTLIHSLYGRVRAYLQQPVTHPSSRQTVSVARKTFTGLANGSRRLQGRVGKGRRGATGRGKEHLRRLVSALSRLSTKNGTMFTFGNVKRKRNGPKAAKDTPEEVTCESREGQIWGNADKAWIYSKLTFYAVKSYWGASRVSRRSSVPSACSIC